MTTTRWHSIHFLEQFKYIKSFDDVSPHLFSYLDSALYDLVMASLDRDIQRGYLIVVAKHHIFLMVSGDQVRINASQSATTLCRLSLLSNRQLPPVRFNRTDVILVNADCLDVAEKFACRRLQVCC